MLKVGGVGYRVFCGTPTLAALSVGQKAELHTHHLVREDTQALYGFRSHEELACFELLTTVSGVGPKVGLAIVSSRPVADLQLAILQGDEAVLTRSRAWAIGWRAASCSSSRRRSPRAVPSRECPGSWWGGGRRRRRWWGAPPGVGLHRGRGTRRGNARRSRRCLRTRASRERVKAALGACVRSDPARPPPARMGPRWRRGSWHPSEAIRARPARLVLSYDSLVVRSAARPAHSAVMSPDGRAFDSEAGLGAERVRLPHAGGPLRRAP